MTNIFSKPQVLLYIFGILALFVSGCTTPSKSVQAEDLELQPVETLEPPLSPSAEAMAFFSLGLNREMEQDYQGAIEAFQEAIRKDPDNDVLYMTASRRLIQAGRVEDAFQLLKQLVEKQPENVTARRWLAKLYAGQNQIQEARNQYSRAVEALPSDEVIYLEAIQLALREKDFLTVRDLAREGYTHADHPVKCAEILIKVLTNEITQARDAKSLIEITSEIDDVLTASIRRFPETETFSLLRATQAIRENQWDLAFETYTELDKRFEGTEEIRSRILLNALQSTGGSSRGVRQMRSQLSEQPESSLTSYLSGLIHEMMRQPEAALAAYEQAVELNPDDFEALRKVAILTYRTGRALRASELLEKVLETHEEDPQILFLAGQLFLGAEDYTKAREYLERSILRIKQGEPFDEIASIYTQLAMSLIMTQDASREEVVDAMVSASVEPGNLEWIWQFSIVQNSIAKENNSEKAFLIFQNLAASLEDLSDRLPRNPEVEWLLGRTYVFEKSYEQAVQAYLRYQELAQASPQPEQWLNESFYFDFAAAYERAGETEKSIALFTEIISKNPDHHPSLNYLAYMWAERNENLDQALLYSKRSLSLDPENGSYLDTLGWIYYQQGKFKAAYKELMKSAELIPDESVVAEHLGDVLMKLLRPWEAMGYYRIALLLDPGERTETVQASLQAAEIAVSESLQSQL